ncbi:MAG TPA: efflux RND transporter periplasmic adaptor subunit [Solirubrobacteraceae bacterium]|jgi:macrolide-specific efflux system membrane fusion protein|nr:efflux RND transporter periplasmic adaptor subunit [Solirubrobacteraceae bacterium]
MTERTGRPWLNYVLGLLCVGAIVVAIVVVGPASPSSATTRRTAKAALGVVQSTVSGSGNLEPASQLNLGFKAAGTVEHVYVKQGQYVTEGRLLATLDPVPSEVTLEQSRANLQSAQATLAKEEETGGEESVGGGTGKHEAEGRRGSSVSPTTSARSAAAASGSSAALSAATRAANISSARAAVSSDRLTVRGDEEALAATRLYAPQNGTIATLTGRASDFAVLSDLSSMKLVAALSEAEIDRVKPGQIATVTVEALEGHKLAAHVSEVATLATTKSGVVSYDVTFALDQMDAGLKPGMSATAEVVVKQEEGVSVPSSAIYGGSVTVVRGGKDVRQAVSTGLAGNSSTIVLSGLQAGETVVLPQASSASSTNLSSLLRSRLGGGAGGGGGGAFLGGGGGAAIFRGGG